MPDKPISSRNWIHGEWAGLIAFTLAIGISISMVISLTGAVLNNTALSDQKANLLSTVFGASIGVIGTYIGAHGRGGRRAEDGNGDDRRKEPR